MSATTAKTEADASLFKSLGERVDHLEKEIVELKAQQEADHRRFRAMQRVGVDIYALAVAAPDCSSCQQIKVLAQKIFAE
jgi:hypothetical protein